MDVGERALEVGGEVRWGWGRFGGGRGGLRMEVGNGKWEINQKGRI